MRQIKQNVLGFQAKKNESDALVTEIREALSITKKTLSRAQTNLRGQLSVMRNAQKTLQEEIEHLKKSQQILCLRMMEFKAETPKKIKNDSL